MRQVLPSLCLLLLVACKPPQPPEQAAAGPAPAEAAVPAAEAQAAPAAAPEGSGEPAAAPDEGSPLSFQSELEFQQDRFTLRAYGEGAGPRFLVISVSRDGKPSAEPARQLIDSPVATAFASDLNTDRAPEILIFTRSGSFVGVALGPSGFTPIGFPSDVDSDQADDDQSDSEVGIEGSLLVRRSALPGGGSRALNYRLGKDNRFVLESTVDG